MIIPESIIPLFILSFGGITVTAGDIFMKKWTVFGNLYLYITGIALYLIGMNLLACSFKFKSIATASIIFIIFNIVSLSFAEYILFEEEISKQKIIGIFLSILTIIILETE